MDNIYCYPGTNTLINKLDIRDNDLLHDEERVLTGIRLVQLQNRPIMGNFDVEHLQKIHAHIFQDIYEWAGKLREIRIGKNGNWFMNPSELKPAFDYLYKQLKVENFLRHIEKIDTFCDRLAYYAAEINEYHPFREGNGRSTREYIRTLAKEAGYTMEFTKSNHMDVYLGFVHSFGGDYTELKSVFKSIIKENIIYEYETKILGIRNAPDELFDKLQSLKMNSSDKEFPSVEEIQKTYNKLGKKIDEGFLSVNDPEFKLLSEIVLEFRKLDTYEIEKDPIQPKQLQQSLDPEL